MRAPFAVVDIGTNSIRLGVVQPERDRSYQILQQQKEVIRLGEGEFASNRLTGEAIDRGILVLGKFAEIARGYGVADITVLGTAALREAANRQEFVDRARKEAGVEVHVISGAEEARLIYLGVLSGIDLESGRALVMDIGGGSTELTSGDNSGPDLLESVKLGAIRMAGIFTDGETGPIQPQLFRRMQEYVRGVAVHSVKRVRERGFDVMYGSSGTILNLAEIVAKTRGETSVRTGFYVTLEDLELQVSRLCSLTLDARRKVPGINPERADIIVAGGAVLTTVMRQVGAPGLHTSERALREGIIVDRIGRQTGGAEAVLAESVRNRSVLQLARRCQFEEAHAQVVARFACTLFDQLQALGIHDYGASERELLYYGALLHDIGGFISYTDHHRHGYYLVLNSPLLGFDATEIRMLAAIVLHHRKALPKRSEALADLGRRQRKLVAVLSTIVRLAESLDRGHLSGVSDVRCTLEDKKQVLALELIAEGDCQLELWGLEKHRSAIKEVFGRRLEPRMLEAPKLAA